MPHLEVELSAYVSDELEEFERKRVEEHIASCRKCMDELQRLQRLDALLVEEELEPDPEFLDGVLWRIDQSRTGRPRYKRIVLFLAAAIVAFFAFLLSLQKQAPEPPPVADKPPVKESPQTPKSVTPAPSPKPEPVEDPELIAYLDDLENMELIREMENLDNLNLAIVMAATEETE
ncbi:zf-HC2 domain-containing protein [bacterium]|nr:zf-HC2 domain-containing protein [bacterium]MCI0604338.1 zf-HC2 domain-containing protein [bacterium]